MGLRITYAFKDYPPVRGGIERHVRQLARGAADEAHDVEVLTTASGRRTLITYDGPVRVVRSGRWAAPASTPLSPGLLRRLAGRLRRGDADVVHLHLPYPPASWQWLVGDGLHRADRPTTVVTYHADVVRQRRLMHLHGPALRTVLRRVDAVIASNAAVVRSSPFLSPLAPSVKVIPFGVDVDWLARPARPPPMVEAAAELGPVVLFVGRFRWYKGLEEAIAALSRVGHDAQLVLVGDGPEAPRLRAVARSAGVADRVHFCGEVTDGELPGAYQIADVFVMASTSRAETFGLSQLEAMAAGTPVISTAVGTGVEVVNQHGVTGLVVPPGDTAALANALDRLLGDDELRRHMGRQAARRARARYRSSTMVADTLALYHELLASRSVSGPEGE